MHWKAKAENDFAKNCPIIRMSENNWLGTWFLKNISENANSNSRRMESLDDGKQGPGEDAANKCEEELYTVLNNTSAGLWRKKTRREEERVDGNNFVTGILIVLSL